jgi:parallel beta-helix repeat protein
MADPFELFYLPFRPAFDPNGMVVPDALLSFYVTGTTTPQVVYADAALTIPLQNPVPANAAGKFPPIYIDPSLTYRVRLSDRAGSVLEEVDPYVPGSVGGPPGETGAADNTYSTLAAFKASDVARKTASLVGVPGVADGRFNWTVGNFSTAPAAQVDVNVVKANSTPLSQGAWIRQLGEQAYVRTFGADPTGATSSSGAFSIALAAVKRVLGSPGDVYRLNTTVIPPADREVIGNGAKLIIASGLEGGFRQTKDHFKVSGWTIQGSGGGYAVWARSLDGSSVEFVDFSDNILIGNVGHFLLCTDAEHITVTGNKVDGLTADTEITTAIVAEGKSKHIAVTGNNFRNITIGWSVQIRNGASDFTVSDNTFEQKQYKGTPITAQASQTVFTFTFEQPCFLRKVQINGKPLSTGYTVTGSNPYTVTFSAGRAAGEIVNLIGYRGAENIQINAGTQGVISGNSIDGTADSGIIALGSNITITGNKVRRCGYAGIAVYGDQDGISVTGNIVEDCAQMDDGLSSPDNPALSSVFAGAILLSGSAATATGNIIRKSGQTMRYGIMINKTDMTVRPDGTPTISLSGNIIDGAYEDGKVSVPNQNPGQRVNSIAIDGTSVMYPEQINLDAAWVETPAASGKFQPADTAYFTVTGSTNTRAVRDTAVKLGGVASLQTVPGEFIDFNLTAAAMLFNTVVTVSFWAKAAGGTSLVEVITTLAGLEQPLGAAITDTNWRQYTISFALTPQLAKAVRIRCSANAGSSANIQYIQISSRRL